MNNRHFTMKYTNGSWEAKISIFLNFLEFLSHKYVSGVILADKDEKRGQKIPRGQLNAYFDDFNLWLFLKDSTFESLNHDFDSH